MFTRRGLLGAAAGVVAAIFGRKTATMAFDRGTKPDMPRYGIWSLGGRIFPVQANFTCESSDGTIWQHDWEHKVFRAEVYKSIVEFTYECMFYEHNADFDAAALATLAWARKILVHGKSLKMTSFKMSSARGKRIDCRSLKQWRWGVHHVDQST